MYNPQEDYDDFEPKEEVVATIADHFDKYLGSVVMINLSTGPKIVGRLVAIDDSWITLEKHDRDNVDIKKKGVYAIGKVKPKEGYAERAEPDEVEREFTRSPRGYVLNSERY